MDEDGMNRVALSHQIYRAGEIRKELAEMLDRPDMATAIETAAVRSRLVAACDALDDLDAAMRPV